MDAVRMDAVKTNRLEYLDISKAIAIVLVVLGHTFVAADPPMLLVTPTSKIIYSFHMPLFFLAAGITSHMETAYTKERCFTVLKKNFYSLLIPYIVFALIYMPFTLENLKGIIYASNVTITRSGARCVHLWFLPCLFVARSFMYGVLHLATKTQKPKLCCSIVMVASFAIGFLLPRPEIGYPLNMDVAFVALGFMLSGYIVGDFFRKMDGKHISVQVLIFIVTAALLYCGNMFFTPADFAAEMYKASYGNVFWFLFNAYCGIIMVRSVSSMIARIDMNSCFGWFKRSSLWLGKNTMGVYLIHQPMNILFIIPWLEALLHIQRGNLGSGLIMAAVILAISILISIGINKVFPQLLGKGFKTA